jgi:hypothetical protein
MMMMTRRGIDGVLPSYRLSVLARRRRGLLAAAHLLGLAQRMTRLARALVAARALERRHCEAIRQLQMLDTRMFADLGLTRGGIALAVRLGEIGA